MPEQPLTAAELERLRDEAQAPTSWNWVGRLDWRGALVAACNSALAALAERDRLQAFKDWTHRYLDAQGVPHHPPGPHGAEGCRIGDRMDWLMVRLRVAESQRAGLGNLLEEYAQHAADSGWHNLAAEIRRRAALEGKES